MGNAAGMNRKPSCSYSRMCVAEMKKAKNTRYIVGEASDFYFLCSDGKTDQVRDKLEKSNREHIDKLVKLERNGDTALHVATEKGHIEIVKLLLEHKCCRTIRNRTGKMPVQTATTDNMRELFDRPQGSDRFHELDSSQTIAHYLPENEKETVKIEGEDEVEALEYFLRFRTEEEIYEYALNFQTTAMWLRFFNWFSRTFPRLLRANFLKPDSFDLAKNNDFKHFLKVQVGDQYDDALAEFNEAHRKNSIRPLLTIYSSENLGFYRLLNKQLADSSSEADTSPHLCDRFIIEFHLRNEELNKHAYRGSTFRGATINLSDISLYEKVFTNKPRGVIAFRAFTSTSEDENVALEFMTKYQPKNGQTCVLFIFQIKHETPMIINIANVSEYPQEKEVLILPGNLFVIKNIRKDVQRITEEKTLTITEIHLAHLHIPVSFRKKLMNTIHSARKDSVTD